MRAWTFVFASVTIAAAGVSGWALERYVLKGLNPLEVTVSEARKAEGRRILYWVAPMDPNYRRSGPGKSPMGMDLIPVYEGDEVDEPGVVSLPQDIADAIGVRYATVQRETLTPEIRTVGRVAYDEDRSSHVHVRARGWIEKLLVRRTGETVREGDLLLELFAPDLSIAAMEYMRELEGDAPRGLAAARRRLQSLGVSERQIREITPAAGFVEHIRVYAPQDGVVTAIEAAEGMFVEAGTTIVSLSDLSHVWVLADVLERDILQVGAGLAATIETVTEPRVMREGVVDTVFPGLRDDTRTIELRVRVDNADGALHPRALTRVTLKGAEIKDVLTVPADAVIRLADSARVVQAVDEGRFRPLAVETGPRIKDRIIVRDGLGEGERIVAAAHFLIDSESSLKGQLERMAASGADQRGDHGHGHGHGHGDAGAPPEAAMTWTDGTVVAVDAGARMVTLEHEPIPELGWPSMVMDFRVAEDVPMKDLGVDAKIRFGFVQAPDRRYEIREIAPAAKHH